MASIRFIGDAVAILPMRMAQRLCGRFLWLSSFYIIDFIPNNDYLVYLHLKIIRYGKGYPCAFIA